VVGAAGRFALLAHPVHRLVLAKPAQLEMADLKDRLGNFGRESIGHQQWSADILAEEFQPTKDVDVPPDNTEIETIARANIAVGGNAVMQSDIDGNILPNLRWCDQVERSLVIPSLGCRLNVARSQGGLVGSSVLMGGCVAKLFLASARRKFFSG